MDFIFNDGGRDKYFKGHAGDCSVRALAIVEKLDYKKIYDEFKNSQLFGEINHSAKNGVSDRKMRWIYENYNFMLLEIPYDFDFDKIKDFNYIIQYDNHVHAVVDNTINDTHDALEPFKAEYIWVKKDEADAIELLICSND